MTFFTAISSFLLLEYSRMEHPLSGGHSSNMTRLFLAPPLSRTSRCANTGAKPAVTSPYLNTNLQLNQSATFLECASPLTNILLYQLCITTRQNISSRASRHSHQHALLHVHYCSHSSLVQQLNVFIHCDTVSRIDTAVRYQSINTSIDTVLIDTVSSIPTVYRIPQRRFSMRPSPRGVQMDDGRGSARPEGENQSIISIVYSIPV